VFSTADKNEDTSYYIISGLGGARTPVPPPLVDPPQVSDYVNICMQWLQSWHPAVDDLTIEP